MKELASVVKKRPAVGITGGLVAGAIGIYGLYSLQRTLEKDRDTTITRDGIVTHIPHDSIATASGATSGGNINVFSEGLRPNADASHSKAEKDISVVAQRIQPTPPEQHNSESKGPGFNK